MYFVFDLGHSHVTSASKIIRERLPYTGNMIQVKKLKEIKRVPLREWAFHNLFIYDFKLILTAYFVNV